MILSLLLFLLTAGTSLANTCVSLSEQPSIQYLECTALPDCTGISCSSATNTVNFNVTVDICEDPVPVTMSTQSSSYNVSDGIYYVHTLRNQSVILRWTIYRNASHISFHADIIHPGHGRAIPHTVIALNASYCMCQSIQELADVTGNDSPVETNCRNNSNCTGLECTFNSGGLDFNVETVVKPCTHPPGFYFIIKQSNYVVYEHFFDNSTNNTVNIGPASIELHATVIHRSYSMIISLDIIANGQVYHTLPRRQIILDKTGCKRVVPSAKPTPTPSPNSTPVYIDPDTCNSLKQIARQSGGICNVNHVCDTIDCGGGTLAALFGEDHASFQVLPCDNPPSIKVKLHNSTSVTYQRVISNTTKFPIADNVNLIVVVNHDKMNKIGFQIKFNFYNITPYTEIPIDRCYCPNATCTPSVMTMTSGMIMTSTRNGIFSTPSIIFHTSTPNAPPTNGTNPGTASVKVVVAVIVPLIVAGSIAVAVVLVVAFIIVKLLRKKRSRPYDFQRLTIDVNGDDDEKDDL